MEKVVDLPPLVRRPSLRQDDEKTAREDMVYWRHVATVLGCRLVGWNWRDSASLHRCSDRTYLDCPGWLGEILLDLIAAAIRASKGE